MMHTKLATIAVLTLSACFGVLAIPADTFRPSHMYLVPSCLAPGSKCDKKVECCSLMCKRGNHECA
ncbi:hypothetical protein BDZ94DRAFT_1249568 [Collybia nuda]|uniref:WAP domain-containing protein n=1 Tax=Collybia nuda TaxID=64659 RepID=A0A9P5YG85_9AGAR|nr:hypothetical protein BDZ94DRAFT_1249568 [Collybia nuda]